MLEYRAVRLISVLFLAGIVLLAAGAPAPVHAAEPLPRWVLPENGAALYDRAWDGTGTRWRGPQNPAVLFQQELVPAQTHLGAPLHDLRDLPLWIAADLRSAGAGGPQTLAFGETMGVAPHRVTCLWGAALPDGSQHGLALVAPTENAAGKDAPKKPAAGSRLKGKIRLVRTVGLDVGRVLDFQSSLDLETVTAADAKAARERILIDERWTFREILSPTDGAFKLRVAEAIERSATNLRDEIARDGLRPGSQMGPTQSGSARPNTQSSGHLALALLAVIKSGHLKDDPVIQGALDALRRRDIHTTYSLACAIMALEALHAPAGERKRLMDDPGTKPQIRDLGDRDRACVERWAKTLLDAHDTRVDAGYTLRWRYASGPSYDNSNTQYALLGLYSAFLSGVAIPRFVWEATATHWLDDLEEIEGKSFRLRLTSHATLKKRRAAARRLNRSGYGSPAATQDRGPRVKPIAWGYTGPRAASGSMTSAGVASLTISQATARKGKGLGSGLGALSDKAIQGGLAWLAKHFTVRGNPGTPISLASRYYYLYGLERALELNRVALLQGRDWYFEGAVWLLESQEASGSWSGNPDDTAFGLLFLKKAVPPVVTPINR